MKKRSAIPYVVIVLTACYSFAQESESQVIDDGDKGSAKYGNLIDKLETAEKAYDAVNSVAAGAEAAEKLKSFDPKKVDIGKLTVKGKEEALAWANKYTNAKGGFNTFARNILQKVDKVVSKVSERVDLWRTTWPTIQRYGKSVTYLADNSKQLFSDFEISDLWDIDRKWDRRLEANVNAYGNTYHHFKMFMNSFTTDDRKRFYHTSIVPTDNTNRFTQDPLCVMVNKRIEERHPYRMVPFNTLEFCSSTMYSLSEINAIHSSPNVTTSDVSEEDAVFTQIEKELSNTEQTYADSRELSAFIQEERAKIRLEIAQITQMQSAVELRYANLIKRDKDALDQQADFYNRSMKILCAGKSKYYQFEDK